MGWSNEAILYFWSLLCLLPYSLIHFNCALFHVYELAFPAARHSMIVC
jgi:hypothetical protein